MYTTLAAMELGPHGIRVNSIAPGLVDTPARRPPESDPGRSRPHSSRTLRSVASGSPDDVAGVALFLASDDASWITGDLLKVDGGAHTKRYPELGKILAAEG